MKNHTTLFLSRQAFDYNIDQIKKAAGPTQELAIVAKANAYGHGILEVGQLAQDNSQVSWICTASISEALALRKAGIQKSLLVLSYLDDDLDAAVAQGIHLCIYNKEDAVALSCAAQRVGKTALVHVKIDTGMSRLGILPENALSFIRDIMQLPSLTIYGIFTHMCDTPNPNQSFSYQQLHTFDDVLDTIKAAGIDIPCIHAQSSSSLCLTPKRPYALIRAGAAAYGIWKSPEHRQLMLKNHPDFDLQQVLSWQTHIIHLKKIEAGATVGYDRTFTAKRPTVLALAPIGYSDGYARGFSSKGQSLIRNHFAPVVGIVSMNLTAFDVTDIPGVQLNDDILLMGPIPSLTAFDCARIAHIITNEMVVNLNPRIARKVVQAHTVEQYKQILNATMSYSHP